MSSISKERICRVCEILIPKKEQEDGQFLQSQVYENRVICMNCFIHKLEKNVSDQNIERVREKIKNDR